MAVLKRWEELKCEVQPFRLCFLCITESEETPRNGVVKQPMTITQKWLDASGHSLSVKGMTISVPLLLSFVYSQNFAFRPLHQCRTAVGPIDNEVLALGGVANRQREHSLVV